MGWKNKFASVSARRSKPISSIYVELNTNWWNISKAPGRIAIGYPLLLRTYGRRTWLCLEFFSLASPGEEGRSTIPEKRWKVDLWKARIYDMRVHLWYENSNIQLLWERLKCWTSFGDYFIMQRRSSHKYSCFKKSDKRDTLKNSLLQDGAYLKDIEQAIFWRLVQEKSPLWKDYIWFKAGLTNVLTG